jgi:hypothetical protein
MILLHRRGDVSPVLYPERMVTLTFAQALSVVGNTVETNSPHALAGKKA